MIKGYTFSGQCKGKTKAGKPCGQRSIYANGYCRHHGGDSTEYMRERVQWLLRKHLKRVKRFERRALASGYKVSIHNETPRNDL